MAEVGSVLASHAFASAGVAAPSTNLPGEDAAQNASVLARLRPWEAFTQFLMSAGLCRQRFPVEGPDPLTRQISKRQQL